MFSGTRSLENKMRDELRELVSISDPSRKAKNALAIIKPVLSELRSLSMEIESEHIVTLHKEIIPLIYAEYIYYASLHNLIISKPFGNRQKEYFLSESERIELWFSRHETFLRYYRSGDTHLDNIYFIPGAIQSADHIDLYSPMIDENFCTHHSFIAAMGIAYQRLQKDITLMILQSSSLSQGLPSLHWTHSKTDLTELIYALYACGAFNKGKATIKEITQFFEEALMIQLGNTSVTFQEILRRKDSIVFLEKLHDSFDHYITSVEEKNIR